VTPNAFTRARLLDEQHGVEVASKLLVTLFIEYANARIIDLD
jgi:hypothetical protein